MDSMKKLLVLMLLISLALLSHGNSIPHEDDLPVGEEEYGTDADAATEAAVDGDGSVPLRGIGRFLAQQKYTRVPFVATCDRYPKICRLKGSPGRDCCGKWCVDTKADWFNCGKCGQRCHYTEICCKGKCVNPMSDKKHCGGCNNKCSQKKGKCVYGMCNYA